MNTLIKVEYRGFAYYIQSASHQLLFNLMLNNLLVSELRLISMSDIVIDLNKNTIVKHRGTLESTVDAYMEKTNND